MNTMTNTSTSLSRLTPAARALLDRALQVALSWGHNYIAPEHIEMAIRQTKPTLDELEQRVARLEAER